MREKAELYIARVPNEPLYTKFQVFPKPWAPGLTYHVPNLHYGGYKLEYLRNAYYTLSHTAELPTTIRWTKKSA